MMSSSTNAVGIVLSLNSSTEQDGTDARAAVYDMSHCSEMWLFNTSVLFLSVCVLVVTACVCCVSYYKQQRGCKRARVYESAVAGDSAEELSGTEVVRTGQSFRNPLALLRGRETPRDNARIYYIYTNPLPVGHQEDELSTTPTAPTTPFSPATPAALRVQDYTSESPGGVVLDPPTFYMQL